MKGRNAERVPVRRHWPYPSVPVIRQGAPLGPVSEYWVTWFHMALLKKAYFPRESLLQFCANTYVLNDSTLITTYYINQVGFPFAGELMSYGYKWGAGEAKRPFENKMNRIKDAPSVPAQ